MNASPRRSGPPAGSMVRALATLGLMACLAVPVPSAAQPASVHLSPAAGDRLRILAGSDEFAARLPAGTGLSSLSIEDARVVLVLAASDGATVRLLLQRPATPGTVPGAWFAASVQPEGLPADVAGALLRLGAFLDTGLPDDPWMREASVSAFRPPVQATSAAPSWKKTVALTLAALQCLGLVVVVAVLVWRFTAPVQGPDRPPSR